MEKKAIAINPRGEVYTAENVKHHLSLRNFMQEMRGAGLVQGGNATFGKGDIQRFAAALDSILAKKK